MPVIRQLPEHLINQIAAGEVVERPASVVKELLENSLDAGCKRLILEVKGGGTEYIRMTDDGSGMEKEDALLCLERHATSKIFSAEDLVNIRTFGFRGEAIASIASVSHFLLQTKAKGASVGTVLSCEGGDLRDTAEVGCPEGTQITVTQLFYNTPARKKYLKNDQTEFGHILDSVTAAALAHPEVAFKLLHDNKTVFDLPATEDLLVRVRALLGRDIAQELIPVFYGASHIHLEGYLGKPSVHRSTRDSQFLFVNRRPVKSTVLSYAVKQAFHSLLPKEKHPVFLLFLTIDPDLVDVNVHPRKQEVKFARDKEIFSIFSNAAKKTLENHVLAPKISPDQQFLQERFAENREHQALTQHGVADAPQSDADFQAPQAGTAPPALHTAGSEILASQFATKLVAPDIQMSVTIPRFEKNLPDDDQHEVYKLNRTVPATQRSTEEELVPLTQMDNSYILCQQGKSLVIVDQHAAHERIRYTEILEEFEAKQVAVQKLLLPAQIELSSKEAAFFAENRELFLQMGFEVEAFGGNTFSVDAVPSYLAQEDIRSTLVGLFDDLQSGATKGDMQARKERALVYAACRSAVKFGDPLPQEKQEYICKRILEMKLPYTCPHGRPTMMILSADELKKRFGRDYRG